MGRKQVDHPLAQTRKKLGIVNGVFRTGCLTVDAGVQENQVQIRYVPKLNASEFSISDDGKAPFKRLPVEPACGGAVLLSQMIPGQSNHMVENRFGNIGQAVADLHQWKNARDVRRGHPQHIHLFEPAQRVHLKLQILRVNAFQAALKLLFQGLFQRRRIQGPGVYQLVEQGRVPGEKGHDPGACAGQFDQVIQGRGAFQKQGDIAAATLNRLEQVQNAV